MSDESWVKMDGDIATIGIKEEAANKVKEFVLIQLPEKGQQINKGNTYATVESIKWSGHLNSPVSGEIIEVNESLSEDPSKINKDPNNIWIIKVKIK